MIEIGHSLAAPFAGQVLADLGATVIKIENPDGGDDARHWGPPFWMESSAVFQTVNRNKYSAAINLKDSAGASQLKAMAARADIVIQNMRPGLVERYGVDAETLCVDNPRLIYCNINAFGKAGPLRNNPGYDPLIQAFSGIMAVTGEVDRPPVRVGPSIIDMGSGLWSVIGVLAALFRRNQTGQGEIIDTSLYEAGLAWMNIPLANSMASGRDMGKSGSETPMLAPYRAYRASDRYIIIAAGNDNLFRRLCEVIDRASWSSDPRFASNTTRVEHRAELNAMIEEVISALPSTHWVSRLNESGVPCAPIQTPGEVIAHPQTEALNIMQPTPEGAMTLVGLPLSFNGVRPTVRMRAPMLGADTDRAGQLIEDTARSGGERE